MRSKTFKPFNRFAPFKPLSPSNGSYEINLRITA